MAFLKNLLAFLFPTSATAQGNVELRRDIKNFKAVDISMQSLMNDIHHSKHLYDKLKVKIHPDRFIGSEKYDLSLSLFQELTENRRNYSKLLEIQDIANQHLLNNQTN